MASLLLSSCLVAAVLSSTALALTINMPVTPAYVREHPREWSVKVTRGDDGLIHFVIKHDVEKPKYHVAHLAVWHEGKLVATSDTPSFGKRRGNTFSFSLSPEDIGESKFDLSDSEVSGTGDHAVPVVGTVVHQFRLVDFVPAQMLEPAPSK